jgi:hypothetical protein
LDDRGGQFQGVSMVPRAYVVSPVKKFHKDINQEREKMEASGSAGLV